MSVLDERVLTNSIDRSYKIFKESDSYEDKWIALNQLAITTKSLAEYFDEKLKASEEDLEIEKIFSHNVKEKTKAYMGI